MVWVIAEKHLSVVKPTLNREVDLEQKSSNEKARTRNRSSAVSIATLSWLPIRFDRKDHDYRLTSRYFRMPAQFSHRLELEGRPFEVDTRVVELV